MTGYVEYATPVYETPHVYFLLKPVQAEQLYAALGKALERSRRRRAPICQ